MKVTSTFCWLLTFLSLSNVPNSKAAGLRSSVTNSLDTITASTCQYDILTKYLHKLAAKYPTISRLISIGKSVKGNTFGTISAY